MRYREVSARQVLLFVSAPRKPLATAVLVIVTMGSGVCVAAEDPREASANTVIGPNPMLSDGAEALMNGQYERGIQLTQLGLGTALTREDRAAAYANLCAGYTALRKYERALENCDQSVAIFDGNWRAWQNRAAANLGLGRIEESMRDIQRGLQLNPDAEALHKTLAIARDYEKQQQERLQHLLES